MGFATDIAAGRAIDPDFHRGNSIYDWVYSGESRSIHYQSNFNFNTKQTKDRSQLNGTGLFIFDRLVELRDYEVTVLILSATRAIPREKRGVR